MTEKTNIISLLAKAERMSIKGKVTFTGMKAHEDLKQLYNKYYGNNFKVKRTGI
ncbi:MAG: hypothetical protein LBL39_00325 [Planctomycetaceae bacterium]|nr:hypothetical protein [Planctomycetaceae bacterium]